MRSCLASTTKILADRNKKMETELSVFYVKIGINVRRHKELINLLTESIDSSGHESVTTLPLNACSLFLFRYVYKIQIQYFHHQNRFDFKKKIKMIPFHQIPLSAIILYRMALEVSVRGNHELALKHLSNAVVLAPQFTLAICEMGYCYEKLGRYLEAIAKFDTVLKINPSHREAEINKNRIQEKLGNKK